MPIQQEYLSARRANEQRYAQAMSIYDEIIKRYQPGGTFGKAALGQLETQKVRDVGRETQQMISSGLYGTTTTAGLPTKWEAEVGAPSRLRLEDIMMQRLSQAQIGKAGFIERREDVYPDVGAYAGYAAQAARAPARTYGRTFGASSFAESGLLYPTGGAAGRLGGGIGGATPTTTPAAAPARAPTPTAPTTPPPGSPAALWAQGPEVWGASLGAERERAGTTGTAGAKAEPTIAEYLQQHGVDPTSTDPGAIRRAQTLQKQFASLYR